MPDFSDLDHDLRLDVLAAEFRLELEDGEQYAQLLADRLRALFPDQVHVERHLAPHARAGKIAGMGVELGGRHFIIRLGSSRVVYETTLRVHGIDLKHRQLSQAEWVGELLRTISEQAAALGQSSQLGRLL